MYSLIHNIWTTKAENFYKYDLWDTLIKNYKEEFRDLKKQSEQLLQYWQSKDKYKISVTFQQNRINKGLLPKTPIIDSEEMHKINTEQSVENIGSSSQVNSFEDDTPFSKLNLTPDLQTKYDLSFGDN